MRVDDGIERWKFRGEGIPDLPKGVKTAADGTFSIEVPKHSVTTKPKAPVTITNWNVEGVVIKAKLSGTESVLVPSFFSVDSTQ